MAIMDNVKVVQAVANQEPNSDEMMKMRRDGPDAFAAGFAAGLGGAGLGVAAGAPAAIASDLAGSATPAPALVGSAMAVRSFNLGQFVKEITRLRCSSRQAQVNRRRDNRRSKQNAKQMSRAAARFSVN